jgi:hypothetical protein
VRSLSRIRLWAAALGLISSLPRYRRTLNPYADDLVALCHSRDEAFEVKARLAGWLAPRGLCFNV